MVGEGYVVEIIIFVVGIEGAPGAVLALHADDPFASAGDRIAIVGTAGQVLHAIHRHRDDGGIVDIGIVRVGVLEGPAAGADIGPPCDPVAADIEHLLRHQPIEATLDLRDRVLAADLQQSVAGEPGIPDRRDAGLAIRLVLVHGQKLLDRLARDGAMRMIFRIAERVKHHHAIRHRRKNRAEPILAIEVFDRPGDGTVDGALARRFREHRLGRAQDVVDAAEEPEPRRFLLRRFRRRADAARRRDEKLIDADVLRVARARLLHHQHQAAGR